MTVNELKTAFKEALQPLGFVRKGHSWYDTSEEVIVVVNLQKSNYSNTVYLNLGFWLQKLEVSEYPPVHQCHIQTRACSLWPEGTPRPEEGPPRIADLFELEDYSCDDERRLTLIKEWISLKLVPTLKSAMTVSGLQNLVTQHEGMGVMRIARETLDLD